MTSAFSVGSVHVISNFEASPYYLGISPDPPTLLYRTRHNKHPFVKPKGFEACHTYKSVHGVYGHTLNTVWKTVGPLVRDILKTQRIRYTSTDVAFFITYGDKEEEITGPVVIWVGVYPGSTAADTADVEVEWQESIYRQAGGPTLLHSVGHLDTTMDVRNPLTAPLGVPIATSERPDAQGTVGFYLHEGGNSEKVMGVTCHHVLFETNHLENAGYEFRGANAPRKYVRLFGLRRFQRLLNSIKLRIGEHGIVAEYHEEEINWLEGKVKSKEEEELRETRKMLADTNKAIKDLERFYTKVETEWGASECRNIGHICYSPAVSYNTEGGYTEDRGTYKCYESGFKDAFMGNAIDLGTEISADDFTLMMKPHLPVKGKPTFNYPDDRLLRIDGIVSKERLLSPDMLDSNNEPCLIVIKDGNTTGVTIGRATGMRSFVRNEKTGEESTELAIYCYNKKSGVFSAKGDSGALIVDGLGRMVGLLTGGTSKPLTETLDVSYAIPHWWLLPRIKAKYPQADLIRKTF